MSRICSGCGSRVARQDCHKNRYGEYLCRTCQASGVKFTPGGKLRHFAVRPARKMVKFLGYVAMALLVLGIFYVILDKFASAPAPASPVE